MASGLFVLTRKPKAAEATPDEVASGQASTDDPV
jgi:hypothetical protein